MATSTSQHAVTKNLNVATGQGKSAAFDTRAFDRGSFRLPAAMTSVAVTFEGSDALAGTYVAIHNGAAGADATITRTVAVSKGYKLPDEVFDHPFVKLVFGSNEAAGRVVSVSLKRSK